MPTNRTSISRWSQPSCAGTAIQRTIGSNAATEEHAGRCKLVHGFIVSAHQIKTAWDVPSFWRSIVLLKNWISIWKFLCEVKIDEFVRNDGLESCDCILFMAASLEFRLFCHTYRFVHVCNLDPTTNMANFHKRVGPCRSISLWTVESLPKTNPNSEDLLFRFSSFFIVCCCSYCWCCL